MLFLVENRNLIQNRERTFLTASVAAAGTTLTVKGVDTNAWANNDWIIVGEIGTPNAEILQINGAVSDGTSLTVDNAGSGGCRFAHGVDEPVYRIDYNKIEVYRATTETGTKTLLTTIEVQPDDFNSRYDDQANTTGFGFVRYLNSFTSGTSPYSDAIPYAGQTQTALSRMIEKIRSLMDEQDDDFIRDDEIVDAINDKQRDILDERLWTFNEVEYSASTVQYQMEYAKPTLIKTLHTVRARTEPLRKISEARIEMLNWDTNQSSSTPTHMAVWNNKVRIYPRLADDAATTQLNGGITASATSITVDDTTGFKIGDFYRFIIDSEVIYANGVDDNNPTTVFIGCSRGQEGTTAATHSDDATVTERDIVYAGQKVAVDLSAQNDETVVPEPIVICYGVAADFCYGKLQKETLGDRLQNRYDQGMENLRARYTLKLTSQFGRVKDPREVVQDNSLIRNPNDFPQNVIAPPI